MAVRGVDRDELLRRRIKTAFLMILACYIGLVARLVYLQGIHGPALRAEASSRREERIRLRAHLGSICDRNGRPMAASLYSGAAGFDPSIAQPGAGNPRVQAKMLAQLQSSIARAATLLGMTKSDLTAAVNQAIAEYPRKHRRFVPLKSGLTLEQAQLIHTAQPPLIGFGVVDGMQRVYSSGDNAAQVIGFLGADGVGLDGLERGCRTWLAGTDGYAVAEVDDHKREIPDTLKRMQPARDGLDVHTTLDADAQHIATEEAQKVYAEYHPRGVSVVILEPATGDIRALVSLPCFDANPRPDRPGRRPPIPVDGLRERCVSSLYEPGSTLKALTVSAALDSGAITPSSYFYCPGQITVGRHTIHCAHGEVHNSVDPDKLLRVSCNVAAAQIGLRLGGSRLYEADRRFGLFDSLDLPLPGAERGHWSLDSNEDPYNRAKAARAAFGQSVTTTPLHVALAYAAIANKGVLMKPRLLTSATDAAGHTVQKWQPQIARRVISEKTADMVGSMLRDVVTDGTGKVAAIPGYQIAGKTGTASKYRHNAYVGSFVGFAPAGLASKPKLVILVAVDEPDAHKAYYGAEVAAPAFKAIASRLLALWHVRKDDPDAIQAKAAAENLRISLGLPPLKVAQKSASLQETDD